MEVSRLDTDTEATLTLGGTVRIADAEAFRATLAACLDTPVPLVTLDLGAVEEVDLTFFQLVLAFQNLLAGQGRHLILRSLPEGHTVAETSRLLGLPLGHHFTQVEAPR